MMWVFVHLPLGALVSSSSSLSFSSSSSSSSSSFPSPPPPPPPPSSSSPSLPPPKLALCLPGGLSQELESFDDIKNLEFPREIPDHGIYLFIYLFIIYYFIYLFIYLFIFYFFFYCHLNKYNIIYHRTHLRPSMGIF